MDKETNTGKAIAYTFVVSLTVLDVAQATTILPIILTPIATRMQQPVVTEPNRQSMIDGPEEVIERPLVGATESRNMAKLKPSKYAHITGNTHIVGAGVHHVGEK